MKPGSRRPPPPPRPAGLKARRGRLQQKIIAWSFIPTALVLVAVALVNFQAYQKVTEELVVQRNRELARLLAARVSTEFTELARRSEDLSKTLSRYEGDLQRQREVLRDNPYSLNIFDGGVWLYAAIENQVLELSAGLQHPPAAFSRSPLFRQVELRSYRRPVISDAGVVTDGQPPCLAVSVPYESRNGYLIGLIRLEASPDSALQKFTAGQGLARRGSVYLVDGNGRVLYHSQIDQVGNDYSGREVVRQVLAGKVGSLRTRDEAGKDVVVSYAPVLGTRWGLVIQENWTTLIAASQGYFAFLLALLAVGVLAPAVVVTLGVRRITRPVLELTQAAQEVAGGRFGRTIQAHTGDEVEDLAEQFNFMSLQLKESYANLEQRVADRTRELATLNEIASVVSRSLNLNEILESALQVTTRAMGMEAGAVLLKNEDEQTLDLVLQIGLSPQFQACVKQLSLSSGAAGAAALTGRPVIRHVQDYSEAYLRQAVEAEGLKLVVSIPLVAKGQLLGVMNLCTHQERTLAERTLAREELDMLASIGNQVGVAIENARLYERAAETATTAERSRLARELHDAVTQTLFSVTLIAEVLPRLWEKNPDLGRQRLGEIHQLARGALAEMRSLLIELRPASLLETEVQELFRYLANAFSGRNLVPVDLEVEGQAELPPEVKVALYRIAQEALNNVARHAGASRVILRVRLQPERASLEVEDNGQGFDPAHRPPGHFGLQSMQERAESIGARLEVETRLGQGTRVSLLWERL